MAVPATASPPRATATLGATYTPPATATPRATATPTTVPTLEVRRDPEGESVFGTEINFKRAVRVADLAAEAQLDWVRYNGILWSQVESVRGTRDWSVLADVEADLQAMAAQGLTPMVIVRGAPGWAQKVPGAPCSAVSEEALDDFAAFMAELASRYSAPPYNVRHWELGNEPDVDPALIDPTLPFGCWGDASDPFYGGGHYAEMLKRVYPAIKAANPQAQVVLGGLLLDCDPTSPPEGNACQPANFLEGILANGGGAFLDIITYHAYPLWYPGVPDSDLMDGRWGQRGGLLVGKLDFIREVMARYDVTKPVMMNEGGLICHENNPACPSDTFFEAQAGYAVRLFTRSWASGLLGSIWFTLNGPGWRQGGLLTEEQAPRPAYTAIRFMTSLLEDATIVRAIWAPPLEGYEFLTDAARYQVLWSNENEPATPALPAGAVALYNMLGQPLELADPLLVGVMPIWIEMELEATP